MPEILYLDRFGDKQTRDVSGRVIVGTFDDCDIRLDASSLDERHIVFYSAGDSWEDDFSEDDAGKFFVRNVGARPLFLSHLLRRTSEVLKPGNRAELSAKTSITAGSAREGDQVTLVWVNADIENVEEDYRIVRLKSGETKDEIIDLEVRNLLENYYARLRGVAAKSGDVARATTLFLLENCWVSMAAIYRRAGHRWKSVAVSRRVKSDEYTPSTTLFRRAVDEGTPILARCEDGLIKVDEEASSPSLSIVASPAKRMVLIPLAQGEQVFGLLYLDTRDETVLNQKDYDILVRAIHRGGIGAVLAGYMTEREHDLRFLTHRDLPPRGEHWKYTFLSERTPYPLTIVKVNEDAGEIRLILGKVSDNLGTVCRVKSFLLGLLSGQEADDGCLYSAAQFASRIDPAVDVLRVGFADITVSYPVDDILSEEKKTLRLGLFGDAYAYLRREGEQNPRELQDDDEGYRVFDMQQGESILTSFQRTNPRFLANVRDIRRYLRDYLIVTCER